MVLQSLADYPYQMATNCRYSPFQTNHMAMLGYVTSQNPGSLLVNGCSSHANIGVSENGVSPKMNITLE